MAPSNRKKQATTASKQNQNMVLTNGGAIAPISSGFSVTHLLLLVLFFVMIGLVSLSSMKSRPMVITLGGSAYPSYSQMVSTNSPMASPLFPTSTRPNDVLSDPYVPPLKDDIYMASQMPIMVDVRGAVPLLPRAAVPVNIPSRGGYDTPYSQIGILTRKDGGDLILPLMGKQSNTARDRYNYYTISNTGAVNTKLPVKVKGKDGMSEYGCDEIMCGDQVYVDGYDGMFKSTIYNNDQFRYLPVL
jgi:hypothetical protein